MTSLPDSAASWIFHWLVQSTVLLGAGILLAHVVGRVRAAAQTVVLRTALCAALLCPALSVGIAGFGGHGWQWGAAHRTVVVHSPSLTEPTLDARGGNVAVREQRAPGAEGLEAAEGRSPNRGGRAADAGGVASGVPLDDWLMWVWIGGAVVLLLRIGMGIVQLQAMRRRAHPAASGTADRLADAAAEIAAQLGIRSLPIAVSADVSSPCLVGILRPEILLPQGSADRAIASPAILAHELIHHARRDTSWKLLWSVAAALMWWQPLVWWIGREIDRCCEHAVDDSVLELGFGRKHYCHVLCDLAATFGATMTSRSTILVRSMVARPGTLRRRVQRLMDPSNRAPRGISRTAIAVILATSSFVTGATGFIGVAPGGQEPAATSIAGVVVGPDGRPVAGATVRLDQETAPVASTDASGKFSLQRPAAPSGPVLLVASADGCGVGYSRVAGDGDVGGVRLQLVEDRVIRGRILDSEGSGAPDVLVQLAAITISTDGEDDVVLRGGVPGSPGETRTDRDGRFVLAGVGVNRTARLRLEGARVHCKMISVATRQDEGLDGLDGRPYSVAFEHLSRPARTLQGIVRDALGQPVEGAVVRGPSSLPPFKAITDARGRFEFVGCAKRARWNLTVLPMASPHLAVQRAFADTPGSTALDVSLSLPAAQIARGTLVVPEGGRLPADAKVVYWPVYPNPNAASLDKGKVWAESAVGADGRFEVAILPGAGLLGVVVPGPAGMALAPAAVTAAAFTEQLGEGYAMLAEAPEAFVQTAAGGNAIGVLSLSRFKAVALVSPERGAGPLERKLELALGSSLRGLLVDPDGKPITRVRAEGLAPSWAARTDLLEASEFTAVAMRKNETRRVLFYHGDRQLAAFLELSASADEPVVVKLAPCAVARGRLVDANGLPVAGVRLAFRPGMLQLGIARGTTDADGRFEVRGVVGGIELEVYAGDALIAVAEANAGEELRLDDLSLPKRDEDR